jgi:hypothetical protein
LAPPTTLRATLDVFDPESKDQCSLESSFYIVLVDLTKTPFIFMYCFHCFRRPATGCLPTIFWPSNVVTFLLRGNAFTEPLPSNIHLLWFHYSGLQASCHNIMAAQPNSTAYMINLFHQDKIKVTLRLTISQSVSLGVEPHLGFMTRYLLLFDSYGLVFVGRPL